MAQHFSSSYFPVLYLDNPSLLTRRQVDPERVEDRYPVAGRDRDRSILWDRHVKMEEVKSGSTFVQLLVAFFTAVLAIIVSYSIFSKRQISQTLKKESAAELATLSQAPVPTQSVQVSKKNAVAARQKALAAEKVS